MTDYTLEELPDPDGSNTLKVPGGPWFHPDITDRFGRVWVWHHRDTYLHDDAISCPEKFIRDPHMQLPNRKLRGNPNYAGLCDTCKSEW